MTWVNNPHQGLTDLNPVQAACHILNSWMLRCVMHSFAIKKAKKPNQQAYTFLLSKRPCIATKCYKGLHCISLHANKYIRAIQVLSTRQSPVYSIQVSFFTEARVKFCHNTQKYFVSVHRYASCRWFTLMAKTFCDWILLKISPAVDALKAKTFHSAVSLFTTQGVCFRSSGCFLRSFSFLYN